MKLVLVTKLDDGTRRAWKQEFGRSQQVALSRIIDFLETRSLEAQLTQSDRLGQGFLSGGSPNCKEDHRLYQCKKLLALRAKERTEVIK